MVIRSFRLAIQIIGGVGIIAAATIGYFAWQFSQGPVAVDFLTPYFERALTSRSGHIKTRIGQTVLSWGGRSSNLDLRVLNVSVVDGDGKLLATVPDISISLSARALLDRRLALHRIEVFHPSLRFDRQADHKVKFGVGEGAEKSTINIIRQLVKMLSGPPDPSRPVSYLQVIRIVSADVILNDKETRTQWRAPDAQISLVRDAVELRGEVEFIIDGPERRVELAGIANYEYATKRVDFGIDFSGLSNTILGTFFELPKALPDSKIPFSGTLTGNLSPQLKLEALSFDLSGEGGLLHLPAPVEQEIAIERINIRGQVDVLAQQLALGVFAVDFPLGTKVHLPAPLNHDVGLRSVRTGFRYDYPRGTVELETFEANLGGPKLVVSGRVTGVPKQDQSVENILIKAQGSLTDVPVDQVPQYWPAALGGQAHAWVKANLSKGTIHKATVNLAALWNPAGGFRVETLGGEIRMDGISVDYLPPMPKVHEAGGLATYDATRFDIHVTQGQTDTGLVVNDAMISLTGLDQVDQFADIQIDVSGPVRSAISLINSKPLEFADRMGVDSRLTGGEAQTNVSLRFPLEHELGFDQVEVTAKSSIREASLRSAVRGLDLTNGRLDLIVNRTRMELGGVAEMGDIPVAFRWRENLGDTAPYRSRYSVYGRITDTELVEKLGLDFPPFSGGYVSGPIQSNLIVTKFDDGDYRMKVDFDLTETALFMPMLDWRKALGQPGRAVFDMELTDERVVAIKNFKISSDDLFTHGAVAFGPEGKRVTRITFNDLKYKRNDMQMVMIAKPAGGWDVDINGSMVDLTALRKALFNSDRGAGGEDDKDGQNAMPPVTISLRLSKVWLDEDNALQNVTGAIDYDGEVWRSTILDGELGGDKTFKFVIEPLPGARRRLRVTSNDAGGALRVLNAFDNMVGGTLELTGEFDDSKPGSPLNGAVAVADYRIVQVPVLAEILNIASLTGLFDRLSGDGIAFSRLDVPFVLHKGTITMFDAKAHGTSLGFTASGKVRTDDDRINIQGSIVPVYALNSLLGKLPVVGDLFSGGEKGGGIFAANYDVTGTLSKPTVTIHPLTALAPGFLRNLFGIGNGKAANDAAVPVTDEPQPQPQPQPQSQTHSQ